MHKKLYKAKKNWVIGLAIGSVLLFGSATGVSADADNNATSNDIQQVNTLNNDDKGSFDEKWISQKVANNQPGQYNDQNVGYINPDDESTTEQNITKYSNDTDYEYYSKKNKKIFKGNGTDLIDTYERPRVYSYNGNDKQLAMEPQPYKHVTAESITSIPEVNNDQYYYLNNGVSNALQFQNTNGDPNYENINELSQYLSLQDYTQLRNMYSHKVIDKNYHSFYNDKENSNGELKATKILVPGEPLSTQELDDLYDAAYDNRPKITFDKELNGIHITSLLQTSINSIDVGWHPNFETGWHGWTFQNGKQLSLSDVLRPESKDFSWKNVVSKYVFQSLKYKKIRGVSDGIFGTMMLDKNNLPVSNSMVAYQKDSLWNGHTEFVFMQDGVYAILSSEQQGYNPVFVQLPMAFLKPEYQAFYENNENIQAPQKPTNKPHTAHNQNNEVDLDELDNEFLNKETGIDTDGKRIDAMQHVSGLGPESRVSHMTDAIKDTGDFLQGAKDSFTSIPKAVKYFSNVENDTTFMKMTSDFHALMNDAAKMMKYEAKHEGLENVLTIGADISDNATSLEAVNQTNKLKVRKNVKSNIKNFRAARKAQLKNTENTLTTLNDLGETVKDINPMTKIIIGAVTTMVALVGIPWMTLKIYQFSGTDERLLKKFKLRKKRK